MGFCSFDPILMDIIILKMFRVGQKSQKTKMAYCERILHVLCNTRKTFKYFRRIWIQLCITEKTTLNSLYSPLTQKDFAHKA
jgi:hypothetical protein